MAIPKSKVALDMQVLSVAGGNDKQIYEELYKMCYKTLCNYATKLLKDELLVEDIVAEVFEKLIHQLHHFDASDTNTIVKWLYTSTRHKCFDVIKQKERIAKSTTEFEALTATDKAEIEAEVSRLIYEELDKLPPQRKLIMIQLYMKGYTSKQVAQRMKLSRQTVINQKVKALKVLRNNILSRLF